MDNILCLRTTDGGYLPLTKEAVKVLIGVEEVEEIKPPVVTRDYRQEILDEYFTFG